MTSGGTLEEILVELAHQHHRPFDEARHFLQQAFILDQFEALRESEIACASARMVSARACRHRR